MIPVSKPKFKTMKVFSWTDMPDEIAHKFADDKEHSFRNDSAVRFTVCDSIETSSYDQWFLDNGAEEGEDIFVWVCW